MSEILKENILFLKKSYPLLFKSLTTQGLEFYPCSKSKETSIRVPMIENRFAHSTVNPEKEGLDWASNLSDLNGRPVAILGMGLGFHVKHFLEKMNPLNPSEVFVIEKDPRLFKTISGLVSFKNLLPKINFILDSHPDDVVETIQKTVKNVIVLDFFPITRIYSDYFKEIKSKLSSQGEISSDLKSYFNAFYEQSNGDLTKVFDEIKKKKFFDQKDYKILLLEEIYKKNRKEYESISN